MMDKKQKPDDEASDKDERDPWGPRCTYCKCGHSIIWYVEPPEKCPYCDADLSPDDAVCRRLDFFP
jgi:hypothetical protein